MNTLTGVITNPLKGGGKGFQIKTDNDDNDNDCNDDNDNEYNDDIDDNDCNDDDDNDCNDDNQGGNDDKNIVLECKF